MKAAGWLIAAAATAAVLTLVASGGWAAEKAREPESRDWSFSGMFGRYDRARCLGGTISG